MQVQLQNAGHAALRKTSHSEAWNKTVTWSTSTLKLIYLRQNRFRVIASVWRTHRFRQERAHTPVTVNTCESVLRTHFIGKCSTSSSGVIIDKNKKQTNKQKSINRTFKKKTFSLSLSRIVVVFSPSVQQHVSYVYTNSSVFHLPVQSKVWIKWTPNTDLHLVTGLSYTCIKTEEVYSMNHLFDSAWTVGIGMYWFDSIKTSRERITTADGETTSIPRLITNKNRNNNNNATLQVRPLSNKANTNTQAGCPGNKRNTLVSHWILTPYQPHRVSSGQSNSRRNMEMHISKLFSCANPFLQANLQQRDLLVVPGCDS